MSLLPILPPGFLLTEMFSISDAFGKAIVLGLLAVSVWVWTIIIMKWRELSGVERADRRFRRELERQPHPFSLYMEGQMLSRFAGSSLVRIYNACCEAARREFEVSAKRRGDLEGAIDLSQARLTGLQLETVRRAGECEAADQVLLLEDQMGTLATCYTLAPMCGLFGTVWGVMVTFHSMGGEGMANLASVAPGISSAMLTTLIGLVVAMPTAVGSNALNQKIHLVSTQMENFTDSFVARLQQSFHQE